MSDRDRGLRGLAVYAISVLGGVTAIASWLCARRLSIGDPGSRALILTAMWISTVARLLATRVVDRGWRAPFPLNQWGSPRIAVLAVPLGIVAAIYFGAYVTAAFAGVPREPPVWHGLGVALNVAVNLPLLAAIDLAGGA